MPDLGGSRPSASCIQNAIANNRRSKNNVATRLPGGGPSRGPRDGLSFSALLVALVGYEPAFSALTFHLYPLLLERGLSTACVVAVLAVIGPELQASSGREYTGKVKGSGARPI